MAYATVAELRAEINMDSTTDDVTLARLLDAASQAIDRYCNRPGGFVASAANDYRYYAGSGEGVQRIDECVSIAEVAVKNAASDTTYTVWASPTTNMAGDGDWLAFSGSLEQPNFNALPYTGLMVAPGSAYSVFTSGAHLSLTGFPHESDGMGGRNIPTVRVYAKWGYAVNVPAQIKTACIMQTARWYKRLQGGMSDTLASGELGMLMYQKSLDPDVEMILRMGRFIRPAIGRRY